MAGWSLILLPLALCCLLLGLLEAAGGLAEAYLAGRLRQAFGLMLWRAGL